MKQYCSHSNYSKAPISRTEGWIRPLIYRNTNNTILFVKQYLEETLNSKNPWLNNHVIF